MTASNGRPDHDLEEPSQWDWESAERRPAAGRAPRAVLSVALSAEEMGVISRAAEAAGKKVSAFVRDAAIVAAQRATTGGQAWFSPVTSSNPVHIFTPSVRVFSTVQRSALTVHDRSAGLIDG